MAGLITLGYFVVGLVAARIVRGRVNIVPHHKSNCDANPKYRGYTGRCDMSCLLYFGNKEIWLTLLAIPFYPVYALCWLVLVDRLPRPYKPDLTTRTERLRLQNQRAMAEIEKIEMELAR